MALNGENLWEKTKNLLQERKSCRNSKKSHTKWMTSSRFWKSTPLKVNESVTWVFVFVFSGLFVLFLRFSGTESGHLGDVVRNPCRCSFWDSTKGNPLLSSLQFSSVQSSFSHPPSFLPLQFLCLTCHSSVRFSTVSLRFFLVLSFSLLCFPSCSSTSLWSRS